MQRKEEKNAKDTLLEVNLLQFIPLALSMKRERERETRKQMKQYTCLFRVSWEPYMKKRIPRTIGNLPREVIVRNINRRMLSF